MTTEPVRIELRENGPIVVTGPVLLADGTTESLEQRVFLCRCGASSTKPRCDGTHKSLGFTAPGVAPARKPEPDPSSGGAAPAAGPADGAVE